MEINFECKFCKFYVWRNYFHLPSIELKFLKSFQRKVTACKIQFPSWSRVSQIVIYNITIFTKCTLFVCQLLFLCIWDTIHQLSLTYWKMETGSCKSTFLIVKSSSNLQLGTAICYVSVENFCIFTKHFAVPRSEIPLIKKIY